MLIGQERAESTLAGAIAQGRVSHAYLFVGPEGTGKHTAALLFAQALNCEAFGGITTETQRHREAEGQGDGETRREGGGPLGVWTAKPALSHRPVALSPYPPVPLSDSVSPCLRVDSLRPCGECPSCRRIAVGTHPDVHVIVPGSKGGQNISVEQMREVRQDVARRPIMGRRKLYLMPNAEAMNEEAANTLLKTLEEPPGYVTLILMATSPTRVLPTVLSRCQLVRFGLAAPDSIRDWLQADGVAAETAAALAITAAGRPGLARRWSREPEMLARRRQLLDLLEEVGQLRPRVRRSPAEAVAALRLAERARALAGPEESEPIPGSGPDLGSSARSASAASREIGRSRRGEPSAGAKTSRRQGDPLAAAAGLAESPAEPADAADAAETDPKSKPRSAFLRLIELARGFYRDLLLLAQGAPETLVGNQDRLPALEALAALYTPAELVAALEAIDRCRQLLERNVAPQLALETLFFELTETTRASAR